MSDDLVKDLKTKNTNHEEADIWMGAAADRIKALTAERDALAEKLAMATMCLEFIGCEDTEEAALARKALSAIKEGGA